MIEVQVAIHKSDIAPMGALKGLANAAMLTVAGTVFPKGGVAFQGFRGTLDMGSRRYVGALYFQECGGDVACADLSRIEKILHPGESDDANSDNYRKVPSRKRKLRED